MRLDLLENGSREMFKAAVHAMSLGLAIAMGLYNLAAWAQRRQRHLAINAFIYLAAVLFEQQQVRHHLASAPECVPALQRVESGPLDSRAA
jgi:hypothetical protein